MSKPPLFCTDGRRRKRPDDAPDLVLRHVGGEDVRAEVELDGGDGVIPVDGIGARYEPWTTRGREVYDVVVFGGVRLRHRLSPR